jgi:hypothetical protein
VHDGSNCKIKHSQREINEDRALMQKLHRPNITSPQQRAACTDRRSTTMIACDEQAGLLPLHLAAAAADAATVRELLEQGADTNAGGELIPGSRRHARVAGRHGVRRHAAAPGRAPPSITRLSQSSRGVEELSTTGAR